jgi:hypothetical protein
MAWSLHIDTTRWHVIQYGCELYCYRPLQATGVAGSAHDRGVKTAMVVNNQEPESGGKEGILAIVAIAVVLFFVIRIYSDYVTKTGQAVKPGHEAPVHHPSERSDSVSHEGYGADHAREKPGTSTYSDDSIADDRVSEHPRKPKYADDEIPPERPGQRDSTPAPQDDAVRPRVSDRAIESAPPDEPDVPRVRDRTVEPTPSDEAIVPLHRHRAHGSTTSDESIEPVRRHRTPGREYARDTASGRPRYHYSPAPHAGQIVIGHEPYSRRPGYAGSNRSAYDEILPNRVREGTRSPYAGQIVIGHEPETRPIHKATPYDDWVPARPHRHVSRSPYAGQIVIGHASDTRPRHTPPPVDDWTAGPPHNHVSRQPFAGQIIIEHAPDTAQESGFGQTIAHRRSLSGVQKPRLIDDIDQQSLAPDRSGSSSTIAGKALFSSTVPYPGVFDDVQIGDRLTEIDTLDLPQGRLSHSVYTYCPEYGPFKTVSAVFSAGPADPAVTRVVYRFRNAKCRAEVRRQAIDAFGEGKIVYNEQGECRRWRHLDGLTVTLEQDRYCIEKGVSSAVSHSPRQYGRTVAE